MSGEKPKETNYIELVSVLFLAAVIVAVILPGIGTVNEVKTSKANLETCRQQLTDIAKALESYEKANGGTLPKRLDELTQGPKPFLKELPPCPAAVAAKRKSSYNDPEAYEFKLGAVPRFTVKCFGTNHSELGLKKDEPYFDSLFGLKPTLGDRQAP